MAILDNAKEFFSAATSNEYIGDVDNTEAQFYHRLSEMIPNTIDVKRLILAMKILLKEEEKYHVNTISFMTIIPIFIDKYAPQDFAIEFREMFVKEVLGINQEPLPDVDYGINEIEEDIIDITDKDRDEVFAALYNASTPIGMGLAQYNPMTISKEIAHQAFSSVGKRRVDGGILFDYVLGRPLKCCFYENKVDVSNYNLHNGIKKGQQAIKTVENLSDKKKEEHTKKKI